MILKVFFHWKSVKTKNPHPVLTSKRKWRMRGVAVRLDARATFDWFLFVLGILQSCYDHGISSLSSLGLVLCDSGRLSSDLLSGRGI